MVYIVMSMSPVLRWRLEIYMAILSRSDQGFGIRDRQVFARAHWMTVVVSQNNIIAFLGAKHARSNL